jgi:hypothetical protein
MDPEAPFFTEAPRLRIKGFPAARSLKETVAEAVAGSGPQKTGGYHLIRNGAASPPLRRETAAAMYERGGALPTDLGCAPGDSGWRSLKSIFPGIRPLFHASELEKPRSPALGAILGPGEWLWDALGYPFRGGGLMLMGLSTVLLLFAGSIGGGFNGVICVIFFAWFLMLFQQVVWDAGSGRDEAPKSEDLWDPSAFEPVAVGRYGTRWVMPSGTTLGLWAASLLYFLPGVLCAAMAFTGRSEFLFGVAVVLLGAAGYYWPMALLLAVLTDSGAALSPRVIHEAVRATRSGYVWLAVLALGVFTGVLLEQAAFSGPGHAGYARLRIAFDSAYMGMVLARSMGLFFRRYKADLGYRY